MKSAFFAFILLASSPMALSADHAHWWENDPIYLPKDALNVKEALPPPPAPHSEIDNADHTRLLRSQGARSLAECGRAQSEVHITLDTMFGPHYGPLKESEVKKWSVFFEEVATDTDYFVRTVKHEWMRPRPYLAFQDIRPCAPLEKSSSYPSGHSAISRVFARVLSEIYPGRKKKFMKRADQIAGDRVLAGIHHPSDIEAGKKLGDEVFDALSKNTRFEQERKRVAGE